MKYSLVLLATLAISVSAVSQKVYYRVGTNFPEIKIDKAPLATATITADFETADSVGLVGKKFYLRHTYLNKDIFWGKDNSYLCYFETEDATGFIVTSTPVNGQASWSLYSRYKKEKKAKQVPEAIDGKDAFDQLVQLSARVIDPRTKFYFTAYNDLAKIHDGTGNWGDPVKPSEGLTFRTADTVSWHRFWFIRRSDGFLENSRNLAMYMLPNGLIAVRNINEKATAVYAPTKEQADQLIAADYNPEKDLVEWDAKSKAFNQNKKVQEEEKKASNLKAAVTTYVVGTKSLRNEPALEQLVRKTLSKDPAITVLHIYFLNSQWRIMKDYIDQIVDKRIPVMALFKNTKDNTCYMKYWELRYAYTGGGTYSTEFELIETYPSRNNSSIQNDYIMIDDADGKRIDIYAGNSYEYDCKAVK